MTTEDDFVRLLDADPTDWMVRLLYADFLEEQGDERAMGMRALGALRKQPKKDGATSLGWWFWCRGMKDGSDAHLLLTEDWWMKMYDITDRRTHHTSTRHAIENAAALAFARLPASRQQELLQSLYVEAK